METQGKLYKKFNTQEVGVNKFLKREFVLELGDDRYPQLVKFELTQDRCSLLDNFQEGEMVQISFDLKGREWKNNSGELVYFNSLQAYRMQGAGGTPAATTRAPFEGNKGMDTTTTFGGGTQEDAADDLPF